MSIEASQGLNILDASDENDSLISRTGAKPDFRKIEASASRQQFISDNILANLSASGQWSSGSLYSSEEFGYGGPQFGRPYDSFEITGDKGLAAGVEFQYTALEKTFDSTIIPYAYYDIGKVWNNDSASQDISASSAGAGFKLFHDTGIVADANLGFPLTKGIDNPLYGNGKNPVIRFGLSYQFDAPVPSIPKFSESYQRDRNYIQSRSAQAERVFNRSLRKSSDN